MNELEGARAVADAVLYEGFLLYPYTASAMKNQQRWQFGVLMPPEYGDASEPSVTQTQLLAKTLEEDATMEIYVRFLEQGDAFNTEEREVTLHAPFAEGVIARPFTAGGLRGSLRLTVERDDQFHRITLDVSNETSAPHQLSRNEALRYALISAHAIFSCTGAQLMSLLDPPAEASAAVSRLKNRRLYPVLIGCDEANKQSSAVALASPIILYDFPQLSQTNTTPMYDATEIDELLLLSVASMTDAEKDEARSTHERARRIIESAESLDAQLQERLHGRICVGQRVRVHPKRRADAIDLFTDGMTARVHAMHEDVDGRRYVSVLFDADPATELHEWYGRSYFYDPDEIEVLGENA